MANDELVSVIVPIYNVEKYLQRCIDSIINQTYKNLEIILVDDGSKDSSGQICDDYTKKDKRIVVIHKKNGGLSDARNAGMKKAKGAYITFIDGDDEILPDYVKILYRNICKYNCGISACSYITLKHKPTKPIKSKNHKTIVYPQKEAIIEMLTSNSFTVSACSKLYRADIVRGIQFPVKKLCEDNGTTYKFFLRSDSICHYQKPLYIYYQNKNSIMRQKFSWKKHDLIELTDKMCDDLIKIYPDLRDVLERRKIHSRISFLRQAYLYRDVDKKDSRIIDAKNYVFNRKEEFKNNNFITRKDKLALFCLKCGDNVFSFATIIFEKVR